MLGTFFVSLGGIALPILVGVWLAPAPDHSSAVASYQRPWLIFQHVPAYCAALIVTIRARLLPIVLIPYRETQRERSGTRGRGSPQDALS